MHNSLDQKIGQVAQRATELIVEPLPFLCALWHILLWSTYILLGQEYGAFVTRPQLSAGHVKAQDGHLPSF